MLEGIFANGFQDLSSLVKDLTLKHLMKPSKTRERKTRNFEYDIEGFLWNDLFKHIDFSDDFFLLLLR